ncbi:hypothetical protein CMUS01_12479 [Colletotrichum musicola]|uniref:Uncharacterized protein n=1 Tax=Colletotrichum musicola TaxID=2175873 RepID=A0A8H6JLX9_9PEZI|nr:hypothetical protein CMUS01_12479 [Colletotrichum musicola]
MSTYQSDDSTTQRLFLAPRTTTSPFTVQRQGRHAQHSPTGSLAGLLPHHSLPFAPAFTSSHLGSDPTRAGGYSPPRVLPPAGHRFVSVFFFAIAMCPSPAGYLGPAELIATLSQHVSAL